jgi:hypothetical protein
MPEQAHVLIFSFSFFGKGQLSIDRSIEVLMLKEQLYAGFLSLLAETKSLNGESKISK